MWRLRLQSQRQQRSSLVGDDGIPRCDGKASTVDDHQIDSHTPLLRECAIYVGNLSQQITRFYDTLDWRLTGQSTQSINLIRYRLVLRNLANLKFLRGDITLTSLVICRPCIVYQ